MVAPCPRFLLVGLLVGGDMAKRLTAPPQSWFGGPPPDVRPHGALGNPLTITPRRRRRRPRRTPSLLDLERFRVIDDVHPQVERFWSEWAQGEWVTPKWISAEEF